MSRTRISIVIPTNSRAVTLRFALRSCLQQDYSDYEIVVCDNCGSPETRQVVSSCQSQRVKFVRSDAPLSMAKNWELALSHASGDWVIVIGDDDALVPNSLPALETLIGNTPCRAIWWAPPQYYWPNQDLPAISNRMHIPLRSHPRTCDSRSAILRILTLEEDYASVPSLYHGAIHRSLFEQVCRRTEDWLFARHADSYCAFAMTYLARQFAISPIPISISGVSPESNRGHLLMHGGLRSEFNRTNIIGRLPTHPWIGENCVHPIAQIADSFWHAKERYFPEDFDLEYRRQRYVQDSMRFLTAKDMADWDACVHRIHATMRNDPGMQCWFTGIAAATQPRMFSSTQACASIARVGIHHGKLQLDGNEYGITNIADAARFCGKFYLERGAAELLSKHYWAYQRWKYLSVGRALAKRLIRLALPRFRD